MESMIGLLTFHWADDYGAMLQAYALKRSLEKAGGKVEIIPYAPYRLAGRYRWFFPEYRICDGRVTFLPRKSINKWRRNLFPDKVFFRRRRAMAQFRRRYLTTCMPLHRVQSISLKRYSRVFVGSDQVWNPDITLGLDDAYIGNIPGRNGCPFISYAASLGGTDLPAEYREKFSACVGASFTDISLREPGAVPFVEKLLGRPVTDTLDPVLLLTREEWQEIAVAPAETDYILLYQTENNRQLLDCAHRAAEQLKKSIVSVNYYRHGRSAPSWLETRGGIGPAQFLGYIRDASCVITNSFHGTAFSILFEKPFIVFPHSTRNARIDGLLEKSGLGSRLVKENSLLTDKMIQAPVDWPDVSKRLAADRERSATFIRRNIDGGKSAWQP